MFIRLALLILPLALFEVLFSRIRIGRRLWPTLVMGAYAGAAALWYEQLPIQIVGSTMDFQSLPILLSILYGGLVNGAITLTVVLLGWLLLNGSVVGGIVTGASVVTYVVIALLTYNRFRPMQPRQRMVWAVLLALFAATVKLAMMFALSLLHHPVGGPDVSSTGPAFAPLYLLTHAVGMFFGVLLVESVLQRARQQYKLQELNDALLRAQEIGRIGSWEWRLETNKFIPSQQLQRMLLPIDLGAGHSWSHFIAHYIHEADRPALEEWLQSLRDGEEDSEIECRFCAPDVPERVIHLKGVAERNERGEVVRWVGTTHDVTDVRRIEQRLQESIQRAKSIIERNDMGICELDMYGNFLDVNPAYEVLTGYSRDELIGRSRLLLWPADLHDLADQLMAQAREGQLVSSAHFTIVHKSGVEIPVFTTNIPIVVDGTVAGFYAMVRDLREELAAEELARQSDKLAVAGQLAASIAHEIRNPLTAIKGFVQLMPTVDLKTLVRYKGIIDTELASVERISSELLMLAKPQADEWGHYQLDRILRDTAVLMEPQALMQSVLLSLHLFDGDYQIYCIEGQLKQVFINMVKNALEATPDGGEISIHVDRKQSEYVVRITDTGRGIPQDVLPRLGEPFYTTKHDGTGLGLMVCHRIIDRHSGRVHYSSSSSGTTVTITLPDSTGISDTDPPIDPDDPPNPQDDGGFDREISSTPAIR